MPAPGGASFALRQVLRQPDGKLLFVSARFSTLPQFAPNPLEVTRVNADLSIDPTYGTNGTRITPDRRGLCRLHDRGARARRLRS